MFHPRVDLDVNGQDGQGLGMKKERLQSLDAFRGLVITVMILVDDAGGTFNNAIGHSPWNNITLADFVMPFFLFIVGVAMVINFSFTTATN